MSIAAEIRKHPDIPHVALATKLGVPTRYVREVRCRAKNPAKWLAYERARRRNRKVDEDPTKAIKDAERDAYIMAHYNKTRAELIGQHLAMTKNAVIGRANRLGLSKPKKKERLSTATERAQARLSESQ